MATYSTNLNLFSKPLIQWVLGGGVLSLGVKRPERDADHSTPSDAEIKNAREVIHPLPIRFHGVVLS